MNTGCLIRKLCVLAPSLLVSGCGTYVPQLEEAWEPVELPIGLEYRIKQHIFCETVKALRTARVNLLYNNEPAVPDSYGVQMQISLTVAENTGINPGLSFNEYFRKSTVVGSDIPNTFNLGLGANLTSTATKTDTLYSYYNVGNISRPGANTFCDIERPASGSSLLLKSNLGILVFLKNTALQARVFRSSTIPKDKEKFDDIYSLDVKFEIISNGNLNPTWKLVNVSANTASAPLLGAGRSRTHELILTFGPGKTSPNEEAIQTHFNGQIVQQLNRINRNF